MIGARIALIAMGVALPGGCAKAPVPTTVPHVVAHIDALNGKTVTITGYLGTCQPGDCDLFPDRSGQADYVRWLGEMVRRSKESVQARFDGSDKDPKPIGPLPPRPPLLGLGGGEVFARKAASFQNSAVLVTGKVTSRCRYQGQPSCVDVSRDVDPTDIEPSDIVSLKDS